MGASASRSGLAIAAMSGAYALAAMQYGRVASRLDHSEILVVAVSLIGAGYVAIWTAGGWALMVSGLVLAGIGQGLLSPNLSMWLAEATPPALRGRVLGGLTTATFLGIFVSPIIAQPMVTTMGFRALCLSAGVLLLTMAALFWGTRNKLRALADRTLLELRSADTDIGTVERQTAAQLQSLDVSLTAYKEAGESPMRQSSPDSAPRDCILPPDLGGETVIGFDKTVQINRPHKQTQNQVESDFDALGLLLEDKRCWASADGSDRSRIAWRVGRRSPRIRK